MPLRKREDKLDGVSEYRKLEGSKMKTLFQMSGTEAKTLASNYLQRLITAGVKQLNPVQNQIYKGLFFYGLCDYWQDKYFTTKVQFVKEFARETLETDAPLVREYQPTVDRWLKAGMPLDLNIKSTEFNQ